MRRFGEWVLLAILGLALARLVLLVVDQRWYATPAFVEGWGPKPYVYRQLAPLAVRAVMAVTGLETLAAAAWVLRAACIGWLWALHAWARSVLPAPAAWTAALLAPLFILPFVFAPYLYDLPHLALFTLALALLARRQWTAYLAIFPLLVLSRETALLLLPVYVLLAAREVPRWRVALNSGVQIGAWVVIKAALAIHFAGNWGVAFETHLVEHYQYLRWYPAASLIGLALLAVLVGWVLWRFRALPPNLQAAALLIPVFFGAYVLFGFPFELRAVVEGYPALYLTVFYLAWTAAVRLPVPRSVLGQLSLRRQLPAGIS